MRKVSYSAEKPENCRFCYFWNNKEEGCSLGKENCYYQISVPPALMPDCADCPYGKHQPCIGWCTKKILGETEVYQHGKS